MSGEMIGPYQIVERLGRGGIGEVWAGVDTMLGRTVAIKVLRSEFSQDPMFVSRFRAEATNLARLHHPNITTIFTLHREGEQLYLVMELVHGRTLEDILLRSTRLDPAQCRAVMAQVIAGFDYAHRMGLIHRDIKPANLMVTDQGLVKIMDFGIARLRGSERMTRQGEVVGTLAYMAPEQMKGAEGDERSDLYSLGVVLYEMVSGQVPFTATSEYELMRAQVEMPPPPLASLMGTVDPGIEAALIQVLAKAPEERFASMEAFGRALGPLPGQTEAEAILRQRLVDLFGTLPPPLAPTVTAGLLQATAAIEAPTIITGSGLGRSLADSRVGFQTEARAGAEPSAPPRSGRLGPVLVLGAAVVIALAILGSVLADFLTRNRPVTQTAAVAAPTAAAPAMVAPVVVAPPARSLDDSAGKGCTTQVGDQVRQEIRTATEYGRTIFKYHSALSIAELWESKGASMSAADQARIPMFRNQAMTLKDDAGRRFVDYQHQLQKISTCSPDVLEPIYGGIAAMDLLPEQKAALTLLRRQVEVVRTGHSDVEAMRAEMDRTLATNELWKP
jgi:hypothetical protein